MRLSKPTKLREQGRTGALNPDSSRVLPWEGQAALPGRRAFPEAPEPSARPGTLRPRLRFRTDAMGKVRPGCSRGELLMHRTRAPKGCGEAGARLV